MHSTRSTKATTIKCEQITVIIQLDSIPAIHMFKTLRECFESKIVPSVLPNFKQEIA